MSEGYFLFPIHTFYIITCLVLYFFVTSSLTTSPTPTPCYNLYFKDLNDLDHLHWNQDDVYDFDGDHVIIKEGYAALSSKVAATLDIRLNTEVKSIKLLDDAASCVEVVVNSQGKSTMLRAGYVVVTLPLGVLKSRLVRERKRQL